MGNKFKHMKQVLTAVLTVAMIFTSVPTNVLAAELENDILSDVITEADDSQVLVDEADVLTDEPAGALIDEADVSDKSAPVSNSNDEEEDIAVIERDGDTDPTHSTIEVTDLNGCVSISNIVEEDSRKYVGVSENDITVSASEIVGAEYYKAILTATPVSSLFDNDTLSKNLIPSESANAITFNLTDLGVDLEDIASIKIDVTEADKSILTFTDDGNETFTEADGETLIENTKDVYKGVPYRFMVKVADHYSIKSVSVDTMDTALEPQGGIYTYTPPVGEGDHTITAEAEVAEFEVAFSGDYKATVNYKIDDVPKGTVSSGEAIFVGRDKDLDFTIDPADYYKVKKVQIDDIAVELDEENKYELDDISGNHTVKITTETKKTSISINSLSANNPIGEIVATYTLDESSHDDEVITAISHSVNFNVNEGSALEITVRPEKDYDIVTAIINGESTVSTSENLVVDPVSGNNMTFGVETGNLEAPELADGPMVAITPESSSIVSEGGKNYVKRGADYVFTAASTSSNLVVDSVSYSLGNEIKVLMPGEGGKYKIPEEDIVSAIKDERLRPITIYASTTYATRTITIDSTSWNKVGSVTFKEATVAYDEEGNPSSYTFLDYEEPIEVNKLSENEIGTGHAIVLFVNPINKVITNNTVKVGGVTLSANTYNMGDAYEGTYAIIADSNKSVNVTVYDPIPLSGNKAEAIKDLTLITYSNGATGSFDSAALDLDSYHRVKNVVFELDYATSAKDYDVILANPTVKAGGRDLDADFEVSSTGSIICTIPDSEIEWAVENATKIEITDNSVAIPKNNLSFVLPKGDYQSDIKEIEIEEYDDNDKKVIEREIKTFEDVSGNKVAKVEVQAGNYLKVTNVELVSSGEDYDFVRVSVDGKSASKSEEGYTLRNLNDKTKVEFTVARLRTSEIAYDPGKNVSKTVSSSYVPVDSSSDYVKKTDAWCFNVDLVEPDEDKDTINKYVVSDVKYAVAGSTAVAASIDEDSHYYVPVSVLETAAFATAVDGKKLTISSDIKKDGYKKQDLALYSNPAYKAYLVDVKENGAAVSCESGYAGINYNAKKVTGTVEPGIGNKLDRVYLIKNSDIKTASVNIIPDEPETNVTNLLAKIDLSKNALPATKLAVDDKTGKASFNISKMDGGYTVIASLKEAAEVYVYPYMVSDAMFSRDDKGVYHVGWNCSYIINYVKGNSGNTLRLSSNTISANCGGEDVTAAVLGDVSGDPSTIYFDPESVAGKTVTVTFADKEGTAGKQVVTFAVSAKPEIKFSAGTVSEGKISKPQQLGVYEVEYPVTITGGDVVAMVTSTKCGSSSETWSSKDYDCPAYAEVVANKNKSNKVTGYKLLVSSIAYEDGYNTLSEATITFYDESLLTFDSSGYPNSNAKIGEVTVQFTTAQVTGAVLKGITTTGNSDSITLNFKDVKGDFVKNTNGLYYHVKVTTSQNDIQLKKTWEGDIPASTTSYTVKLAKDDDTVQPDPVTYKVEVTLVQKYENAKIAESTAKEELSATTIADKNSIYATKVKLKKNSAVKTIYGGKTNGMGWFQLATVTYPAPKNVTVQRVKKVELYKGGELICDVAAGGSNKFIKEEQNIISLRTVYPYDDGGETKYKGLEPGKYTAVAYAVEPMGKDVVGKLNFTVSQAIEDVDVTIPSDTLYVAAGKKTTIKASVVYNGGDKKAKPKTKKVKWYTYYDDSYDRLPAGVTFKNGTITVAKYANIPAEGWTIYITAQAADFAGNDVYDNDWDHVTIMPLTAAPTPAQIMIGDTLITSAGGNFRSDQVYGRMTVLGNDPTDEFENVSIKVSGALKSFTTPGGATQYYAAKTGKATIKVTTTDGSKKSKTFKIKVVSDTGINGELYTYDNGTIKQFDSSSSTYTAENNCAASQPIYLVVYGDNSDAGNNIYSLINASIKIKGFKKLKNDDAVAESLIFGARVFKLQPTKRDASITINGKTVINVTNTAYPENSKKIKITQKKGAKIYNYLEYTNLTSYNQISPNKITYTVAGGKEGDHVRIYVTKDTADGDIADILDDQADVAANLTDNNDGTFTATLDKAGTFAIDYIGDDGKINIKKGTYKLQMTPVDENNKAVGNSVTLNLKVVKTPKISVKLKTLKINFASGTLSSNQQLVIKTQKNVIAGSLEFGNKDVPRKNVLGFNTKGKINKFHEMFTLDTDGKLTYTGKLDPSYNAKKGINGWAAVTYTGIDGVQRTDYFKLTVKGAFVSSN